jgi:pimeloyl-ACP methyl ester carboxylesterase
MVNNIKRSVAEHTISVNLAGLDNQILYIPGSAQKNHNILFVYGHFGTIANYFSLANDLSKYGNITVAELPGFNNHQSLYKIHDKPTIDELAEYLATIVNYRFRKSKLTIVGVGFGIVIVTRMLQRHASLARKVNIVISIDGMAHHDDLISLSRHQLRGYAMLLRILSWRPAAQLLKNTNLPDVLLEKIYGIRPKKSKKNNVKQRLMDWRVHDFRTYMRTMYELLRLDNCQKSINVKFAQVWSGTLNCLDREVTDQHLQVIFDDFQLITSLQKISKRADSVKQMYAIELPKPLRKLLLKTAKSSVIE